MFIIERYFANYHIPINAAAAAAAADDDGGDNDDNDG